MTKYLSFLILLISFGLQSQNLNGTYLSDYSDATYPDNKRESFDSKSVIKVEINEDKNPIGILEITVGSENKKLKYALIGDKKYEYIGDKTYIIYNAEFGASKLKCLVGFEVHMKELFIKLENNSFFAWEIKEKL